MIKKVFIIFLTLNLFFIFNTSVFALENESVVKNYSLDTSFNSKAELKKITFTPEEKSVDTLFGIILSTIPGFGVGHFWIGDEKGGWFFLQMDLIMLIAPLVLAMTANFSSGIGLIVKPNEGIFAILGLIVWMTTLGIKIWEVGSVWRYIKDSEKQIPKSSIKKEVNLL